MLKEYGYSGDCNRSNPSSPSISYGKITYSCSSPCTAIDAWKGHHDANELARREQEKLDVAAGRGHSTEVEKLERRETAGTGTEGFSKKIMYSKPLVTPFKSIGRMLIPFCNKHVKLLKNKDGSQF